MAEAAGAPRRAVVVSGAGRYADPWHDFRTTSARLEQALRSAGFDTVVDEDVDGRLAAPGDIELLVVNIGAPAEADEADASTRAGLLGYLARGRPLLVSHVSSTSLTAVPEWEAILGGVWVRDITFHPEYGPSHVEIVDTEHPIVRGLGDFDLVDERYTDLRVSAAVDVLAVHRLEGRAHPLVWAHRYGASRVVYDALGHDTASYDSAAHLEILRRAADWLTGQPAERG